MPDPADPLAGKVAIVAGASKRLGRCYAMALAKAGARVVALARTLGTDPRQMGTLIEVEATARAQGLDVTAMRCDLVDEQSVKAAIEGVAKQFGRIDCLVNNAVMFSSRRECRAISAGDWNLAFAVNVRAPYLLIDAAIPVMQAGGGGSIVNITSLSAGKTGKGGGAHKGLLLYGLTKAALNRMTTWYAAELEEDNIAVNAISPGDVSLYMVRANDLPDDTPNENAIEGEQLDERFWGDPVVWLAGARPAQATGEVLHTYTFGTDWGERAEPVEWPPLIRQILGRDNLAAQP